MNAEALKRLTLTFNKHNTTLIHIFDGTNTIPFQVKDTRNPIKVYVTSKLKAEQYVQEIPIKLLKIRTSWVFSKYRNNFVKNYA